MIWFYLFLAGLAGTALVGSSNSDDASDDDTDEDTDDNTDEEGSENTYPTPLGISVSRGFEVYETGEGQFGLIGTAGDNMLSAEGLSDVGGVDLDGHVTMVRGGAGNDNLQLYGVAESLADSQDGMTIYGGAGDDTITGSEYFTRIFLRGGAGDDEIISHGNISFGGSGDDLITVQPFSPEEEPYVVGVFGDDGNDTIEAPLGLVSASGGAGDDVMGGQGGSFYGDAGDDAITLRRDTDDGTFASGGLADGGDGDDTLTARIDVQPDAYFTRGDYFLAEPDTYDVFLSGGAGADEFVVDAELNFVSQGDAGTGPVVIATLTDFDPAEDVLIVDFSVNNGADAGLTGALSDWEAFYGEGVPYPVDGPTTDHALGDVAAITAEDGSYTDYVFAASATAPSGETVYQSFAVRIMGEAGSTATSYVSFLEPQSGDGVLMRIGA